MADEYGFDSEIFSDVDNNEEYVEEYDEYEYDAGEEDQEAAEPDEDEEYDEGENDQEVAEPDEEEGQSAEENSRYAAARRKAERDAELRIEQMRQEMLDEESARIAALGIVDPYTGETVDSMEGFQRYTESLAEERRNSLMEKMTDNGLTEEEINSLVSVHPDVMKAREESMRLEQLEQQKIREQNDALFKEELEKIMEMDPTIRSASDLFEHENRDAMEAMIRRNYSISDAYFLANKDALIGRQLAGAKQETRNSLAGRGHMEPTASRGSGGVEISAEDMKAFREIMPNASDAEIRKFYERDLKRTKKK